MKVRVCTVNMISKARNKSYQTLLESYLKVIINCRKQLPKFEKVAKKLQNNYET